MHSTPASSSATQVAKRKDYYLQQDVDFNVLAKQDPDFAAVFEPGKSKGFNDFKDPKVVLQLTKTLLKFDFGLDIELAPDRLCPPVPGRWNYVRWLQDLVDTTERSHYNAHYDPDRKVVGIDIGTGASCIYPLLACSSRPNWHMIATDIDQTSLQAAHDNVSRNQLDDRIIFRSSDPTSPLIPLTGDMAFPSRIDKINNIDFIMTNPPFYESAKEMEDAYKKKSQPSSAVCTGTEREMICPGGEVGFVTRMFDQGLNDPGLQDRVQWFTAMFGKLESIQTMVRKLGHNGITNFAVTVIQAGHKTKRWVLAWSFQDFRPRNDIARHGELTKILLAPPTAQTIEVPLQDASRSFQKVQAILQPLEVEGLYCLPNRLENTCIVESKENLWNRAAIRKRRFASPSNDADPGAVTDKSRSASESRRNMITQRSIDDRKLGRISEDHTMGEGGEDQPVSKTSRNGSTSEDGGGDSVISGMGMPSRSNTLYSDTPPILVVKITCMDEEVEVRWLRGNERKQFVSFCGFLKAALTKNKSRLAREI